MNLPPLPEPVPIGINFSKRNPEAYGYRAQEMREYGEACRKQALEETAQIAWNHEPDENGPIEKAIRSLIK